MIHIHKQKHPYFFFFILVSLLVGGGFLAFRYINELKNPQPDISGMAIPQKIQQKPTISSEPFSVPDQAPASHTDTPPKIPPPNLSWKNKSKTINGVEVYYVFGEGNPKEVALTSEEIQARQSKGYGYVTPEVEFALKDLLQDSRLVKVLEKCYKEIDWYNRDPKPEWAVFPQDLSLENMLVIDPETGRKELNRKIFDVLHPLFTIIPNSMPEDKNFFHKCLGSDYYDAVGVYGHISTIGSYYMKGRIGY
jgi:hypothetical protein